MRLIIAAALTLFFAAPAFAAGEVYKWKDDAGVVHYTDAPPEGREYETMKGVRTPPAAAPVDPAAANADGSSDPAAAPAPPPGSTLANCESARRNVENMQQFDNISMDRDGDGTAETLTPEQKAEELKRNQALVDLYCPKPEGTGA